MLDELRTRALVLAAGRLRTLRLRPFFVVFLGLSLVQMLSGCIFSSERPDARARCPAELSRRARGNVDAARPALDWWRGFRSRRAHQADRRGADRQSRHRRRHRPHHAGRCAEQDRRRAAASVRRFRPAARPARSRRAASSARTTGPRSTPPTRSISGARTAPHSRAAQETAVATRFAKEVVVLSTIAAVGTAYFQVLAAQDQLRIARSNLDASNRVLTLIKQRFDAGTASQLDVSQQESLVATVRATHPALRPDRCARTSPCSPC